MSIKKTLILTIASITTLVISISCSSMGTSPSDKEEERFSKSKNYNKNKKKFENRRPDIIEKDRDKAFTLSTIWEWFMGGNETEPDRPLAQSSVDIKSFLEDTNSVKFIWLGHSTLLINFEGKIILLDPIFSNAAAPVSFVANRFQDPVIPLKDLPPIDAVLISHDHYDHLDMNTVKFFRHQNVMFITPLGVGSHLKGWGVDESQIIERDWMESFSLGNITFTATPSQHFSGRGLTDTNKTLWASWVISSSKHKVYFSGDSGYDTHYKTIGEKFGPFDIAFIENGQYDERWGAAHMRPEEVALAYKELQAKKVFPIHWGMFALAMHPWYEPPQRLLDALESKEDMVIPRIGYQYNLEKLPELAKWWEKK